LRGRFTNKLTWTEIVALSRCKASRFVHGKIRKLIARNQQELDTGHCRRN
jgi:hypothetical protein